MKTINGKTTIIITLVIFCLISLVISLVVVQSEAYAVSSYSITYSPGDNASGYVQNQTNLTDPVRITMSKYSREQSVQIGWSTSNNGSKNYDFDESYTRAISITLYPVWESAVASVKNSSSDTNYTTFREAWQEATNMETSQENRATVKIFSNLSAVDDSFGISVDSTNYNYIYLGSDDFITLDLNGYTIDRNLSEPQSGGYVIKNEGNLIINDTSEQRNGSITGGNNPTGLGGGITNFGTLKIIAGHITANSAMGGAGVNNQGTFNFSGGFIENNQAISYGGGVFNNNTCTFENGIVSGNQADYGGGISNNGMLIMNNGQITANRTTGGGGGLRNTHTGTVIMNQGEISRNTSENIGGGVYSTGIFKLYDGSIIYNTTEAYGGGVFCEDTFIMNGGELKFNKAEQYGGGVANLGTFTFNGGEINYNIALISGGGVYNYLELNEIESLMNISGRGTIGSNFLGGTFIEEGVSGGVANNVSMYDKMILSISDGDTVSENDTFTGTVYVTRTAKDAVTQGWSSSESSGSVRSDDILYGSKVINGEIKFLLFYAVAFRDNAIDLDKVPTVESSYLVGDTFTIPEKPVEMKKANYSFSGWSDGTNIYSVGDTYTVNESSIVFTAVWIENAPPEEIVLTSPIEEAKLSGGDIALIVIGSLLLVLAAGFAVFYIINKKKVEITVNADEPAEDVEEKEEKN